MIGEGVVSLLVVNTVRDWDYYIITIFGTLTMMFIQILKFESEPHRAEEHALWRSFHCSMSYSYLIQILSLSLIALQLIEIYREVVPEQCPDAVPLIPFETEASLFCWSLTSLLLSLELVKWTHSGRAKAWDHLTKPSAGNAKLLHCRVIITEIFKLILLIVTVMLQYWTTSPWKLTLCGFAVVLAYTATM